MLISSINHIASFQILFFFFLFLSLFIRLLTISSLPILAQTRLQRVSLLVSRLRLIRLVSFCKVSKTVLLRNDLRRIKPDVAYRRRTTNLWVEDEIETVACFDASRNSDGKVGRGVYVLRCLGSLKLWNCSNWHSHSINFIFIMSRLLLFV